MVDFDPGKCDKIVLGKTAREKYVYRKIAQDLANTIAEQRGFRPEVVVDSATQFKVGSILIGGPKANRLTAKLVEQGRLQMPAEILDESHFVKAVKVRGGRVLVVAGNDERGDMYGTYWLIDRIKAGKTEVFSSGVFRRPAFRKRLFYGETALFPLDQVAPGWEDPYWQCQLDKPTYPYVDEAKFREGVERFKSLCDIAVRCGYNTVVTGDVIHLVTFDKLGIYPKDSTLYVRHKKYQEFFKEMIAYAKSLNLEFYIRSDEIVYTKPMEEYAGKVCHANPKFWELFREKYSELFETFPEIDGVLHRLGEVYLYEPYRGIEVTKNLWSPLTRHVCPACEKMTFEEKLQTLVRNTLEVTHKYNKTYIHRTWGFPTDKPDAYLSIIKGLEEEKGFITTMKYMSGDWWWTNPLNPVIGKGEAEQLVLFISKRQMEGHGMFPTYVGELYKKALKFAQATKTVRHMWIWVQESGWAVPNLEEIVFFKGFTYWSQLNFYTTGRLAWDPDEDTYEIAYDWAAMEYGRGAAKNIADLLMISKDVVEKGFYIRDYAKNHDRGASLPLRSGTTIEGGEILRQIYEECKSNIEANIQDAVEAVELCDRMISLFKAVEPHVRDKRLYDLTLNSIEHMRSLVTLLRYYREAFLRTYKMLELDPDSRAKELPLCKRALQKLASAKEAYDERYGVAYTHGIFEFLRSTIPRRYILPSIAE